MKVSPVLFEMKYYDIFEFFTLFLENGIDPDQPIKLLRNKSTLLCWSIYNNNKELFNLLLEKGANVNSIGENGSTPLTYSILLEDKYYIEKLIEKGADVNKLMKKSPALPLLFIAIDDMASISIIELIIDSGANIYYKHRYSDEREENIKELAETLENHFYDRNDDGRNSSETRSKDKKTSRSSRQG
jgi:ankyrin repeat protein